MAVHKAWVSVSSHRPASRTVYSGKKPNFTVEVPKRLIGKTLEEMLKYIISDEFKDKVLEKYTSGSDMENYGFIKKLIANYFSGTGDGNLKTGFTVSTKEGQKVFINNTNTLIGQYFQQQQSGDKVQDVLALEVVEKAPIAFRNYLGFD